jgi:putative meiotic phospholipase SPO1
MERQYMLEHKKLTKINLYALLNRNRIPLFDHYSFLADETRSVSIGFAISGGGYRSMLTGAGVIAAFDARTTNSTSANGLGGLLQSGNYIAGISGGAWLVMNLLASDFQPVVESIQDQSCSWDLGDSLLEGVPNFDPEMLETQVAQLTQDQFQPVESKKPPIVNTENPSKLVKLGLVQNLLKIFNFSYRSSNVVTTKESTNKEDGMFSKILKPILFKKHASADRREDFAGSIKRVIYYYRDIHLEIRSKKMAGFPITLTDYWGRALARRIFPRKIRTPGVTMTSVRSLESFRTYQQPFPIICAIEAVPEKQFTSETSHTLEITPFEFGSWEPHLNSFVNVTYLGTRLQDGRPQGDNCVTGYDNLGFLTGVSSSVFNYIFVYLFQNLLETQLSTLVAIQNILKSFGLKSNSKSWYGPQQHPDFAMVSPNPFFEKSVKGTREISKKDHIYLTDGGGDGQNIPFHPFLQYSRKVDVVFAFDMSGDLENLPNGTSLIRTSKRYHSAGTKVPFFYGESVDRLTNKTIFGAKSVFPKVPSYQEFQHDRPFFLGCDLKYDYADKGPVDNTDEVYLGELNPFCYVPPLIIYTANTNHSFPSNRSTFQLSYSASEVRGMIQNGYNLATFMNGTVESDYAVCVSCALLKREFDRLTRFGNFTVPEACNDCYAKYCYR